MRFQCCNCHRWKNLSAIGFSMRAKGPICQVCAPKVRMGRVALRYNEPVVYYPKEING